MSESDNNSFLRFSRLLHEREAEPVENLTEEEMNKLLMSQGTHVLNLEKRWSDFVNRGTKELALEIAQSRRQSILENVSESFQKGTASGIELLNRAKELVAILQQKDPEQAAIFARKFEQTTAEDIESLAFELAILEKAIQEDEDSNRDDKG